MTFITINKIENSKNSTQRWIPISTYLSGIYNKWYL